MSEKVEISIGCDELKICDICDILYPVEFLSPKEVKRKMRKLLIADAGEEFCLALADMLSGNYTIRMCQDGKQALELLESFRPDVMVLDLTIPGTDGITLLERAAAKGFRPTVLATTRFCNDYVQRSLEILGVGYLMVKPCDLKAVEARLSDLTRGLPEPVFTRPDNKTVVSNVLLSLSIQAKHHGFSYLRDAIVMELEQPGRMITKEIYPVVGKPYHADARQVERAIRTAVEKAWVRRNEQVWKLYFQAEPDGTMSRPSNGTLISVLAAKLQGGGYEGADYDSGNGIL